MKPHSTAGLGAQCWPYLKPAFQWTLGLGLATNLLALNSTWYMLEVYDRVITSMSHSTLIVLTVLVLLAYLLLEVMETIRHGLMKSAGDWLEERFSLRLYALQMTPHLYRVEQEQQATMQDLSTVRQFLSSNIMLAILDLPYALLVLLILLAIHPLLAVLSLGIAVLQVLTGWFNDRGTRTLMGQAASMGFRSNQFALSVFRNPQVTRIMGMTDPLYKAWQSLQQDMLKRQAEASIHAGFWTAGSKWLQTLQSSLLIGLGCLLTLEGQLDPHGSMIIVGSVLGGRLMVPLAQVIPHWRQVVQAQMAWSKLSGTLQQLETDPPAMPLPPPRGELLVAQLTYQTPKGPVGQSVLLRGIQFKLDAGQTLCILGPSGAGKTTLARMLTGLLPPTQGSVRLDGVNMHLWSREELGPHIGYLPAQVELLDGSVAQNIARFSPCSPAEVQEAAKAVGLHELIGQLPQGYDTPVGQDGSRLSGGMRQRVGLARAFFRQPRLLVLDEPNANLDEAGNAAFLQALRRAQESQATVVVISHRTDVVQLAHKLLILREGQVHMFGPTLEVVQKLQASAKPAIAESTP